MHRREFLALSGGLASGLVGCAVAPFGSEPDLFLHLVSKNDERVAAHLDRQQLDPALRGYGGTANALGLFHAGAASGLLRDLACAYAIPESRFHRSALLIDRMLLAARFLRRVQHDDGTIDLITTNFHSTPDTGFVLEWVCAASAVLRELQDPRLAALQTEVDAFIVRGADALSVGGIHTPNHRWVVCMALARAHALHPNPRYVARIDRWLGEGIDIDPDGQYTERSTAIYTPLTNRCLITVARLLDRPELLEPVRKNLAMTLYYLHADGEIATEGSRRQDQYRRGSLAPYYVPYRTMAQIDGDGRFATVTRLIEKTAADRLSGNLVHFLERPELRDPLPRSTPLPESFEKHFEHSGLVRLRRGPVSATILEDNSTFLSLHKGSAAVVVRFASAFFGKGQFVGEVLRKDGDAWAMRQELTGPYYQPFAPDRIPGDGDWWKMPRDERPHSEVQRLSSEVRIREVAGGVEMEIDVSGTDGVPVSIELGFRNGGHLEGVEPVEGEEATWLLNDGASGRFTSGDDVITFGPGHGQHRWTQVRGALPKLDADCVYLTAYTPLRTTLRLT